MVLRATLVCIAVLAVCAPTGLNLVEALQCRNDIAAVCCNYAIKSVEPSACNWNIIIPLMSKCIYDAIDGCPPLQVERWKKAISDFGDALYRSACATLCPNPDASSMATQQCFSVTDTVTTNQFTSLSDLVAYIIGLKPTINQPACSLLGSAIDCLNVASVGCTALMDIVDARLDAMDASLAIDLCNVSRFVTPTTSEPLAIFNSVSVPQTTTVLPALGPGVHVGDGVSRSENTLWIALIVLASVSLVIVIFVIGILVQRILAYRRNAKRTNRQLNGEKPERPAWRQVRSTDISDQVGLIAQSNQWPTNQRQRGNIFS